MKALLMTCVYTKMSGNDDLVGYEISAVSYKN